MQCDSASAAQVLRPVHRVLALASTGVLHRQMAIRWQAGGRTYRRLWFGRAGAPSTPSTVAASTVAAQVPVDCFARCSCAWGRESIIDAIIRTARLLCTASARLSSLLSDSPLPVRDAFRHGFSTPECAAFPKHGRHQREGEVSHLFVVYAFTFEAVAHQIAAKPRTGMLSTVEAARKLGVCVQILLSEERAVARESHVR